MHISETQTVHTDLTFIKKNLNVTNDLIKDLYKMYLSEDSTFFYYNEYFGFCSAVFLYLYCLKQNKNELAIKYLTFENTEEDMEKRDKKETDDVEAEELPNFVHDFKTQKTHSDNLSNKLSNFIDDLNSKLEKNKSVDGNWGLIFFNKILRSVDFICEDNNINPNDSLDDDFYHEEEQIADKEENQNDNTEKDEGSEDDSDTKSQNSTIKSNTQNQDNEELKPYVKDVELKKNKILKKLYFIANPMMSMLTATEIDEFTNTVNRESAANKVRDLIEFYYDVTIKFKFEQNFQVTNPRLYWALRLNYYWIDLSSFIYILLVNIYQIAYVDSFVYENTEKHVDYLISVKVLTAINVIYNLVFLCLYSYTKQMMINFKQTIKIEQEVTQMKENINQSNLKKIGLFLHSYFSDSEKYNMIAHIIIGCIAVSYNLTTVFISLELITFTKFTDTGTNILKIFRDKIGDLLQMVLFLIIVTYMLSNFSFFFLNEETKIGVTGTNDEEQVCKTLYRCFVSFFNIGIRAGSGIGEAWGYYKWTNNLSIYFERYFLEFIFFIFISLFLLNMINGIIITPFGEWREKDEEINEDKDNVCFICSLNRTFLQQKLVNFDDHRKYDHSIKAYLEYLIYLKNKPDKDLDAEEGYINNKIKNKNIDCFPINLAFDPSGNIIENFEEAGED